MAKPPKNLALEGMTVYRSPFDEKFCSGLVSRFGFVCLFTLEDGRGPRTLRGWLDWAGGMYLCFAQRPQPSARERKDRIRSIAAAAQAEERERLDRLLEVSFSPWDALVGAPFATVTERAQEYLGRKRATVPGGADERILFRDLALLWCGGTGRKATITWDPHEEKYCGRYLEFLGEVCRRLRVRRSPTALAKIHKRIQRFESP